MKRTSSLLLTAALAAVLSACSTTPERIEALETARAIVPQVEASPRAGVAATYIAEARKSLDRANRLADDGGKLEDIEFEAEIAAKNAQIANEKILTAQAREEIEKGTAERQAVLIEAREREARLRGQQADEARARASTLEQELEELRAKPTPRGMVLTLGDVLFDTAQATLKPGAYGTIDRLANALEKEPDRQVIIEGHTDSVGSDEYNQGLSQRRADAVKTALLERGVRSEQIRAVGKGESTPVASNDNAGGRQQNRRVEMIFANTGSQVASDVD
jgi:outer membrane protein OmpA-like peptidoglycan-associated protein